MALRKDSSLQDEAAMRGKSAAAPGGTGSSAGSSVSGGLPPYRVGMTAAVPINTPNTIQQQGQANFLRTGVRPPSGGDGSVGKDINLAASRGQEMTGNVAKDQSSYNVSSTTMASSTGSSSSAGGFVYDTSRASGQQYKEQAFQRSQKAHQLQHLLQREQLQHGPPAPALASHSGNAVFPGAPSSSSGATVPVTTSAASLGNSGLNAPPREVEPTLANLCWPTRGQKLQSLMSEVDDRFTLLPETSDLLLQMVESFVETVATQSVRAAKHRNSEVLEVKDIQLCLEKHWGMPWIGVGPMPAAPSRTLSVVPNGPNATFAAAQTKQKSVCAKRKDLK